MKHAGLETGDVVGFSSQVTMQKQSDVSLLCNNAAML